MTAAVGPGLPPSFFLQDTSGSAHPKEQNLPHGELQFDTEPAQFEVFLIAEQQRHGFVPIADALTHGAAPSLCTSRLVAAPMATVFATGLFHGQTMERAPVFPMRLLGDGLRHGGASQEGLQSRQHLGFIHAA